MPYFLGLTRSRLGQNDGPIIFQKIVPFQAGANEECLVQVKSIALAGRLDEFVECASQLDEGV